MLGIASGGVSIRRTNTAYSTTNRPRNDDLFLFLRLGRFRHLFFHRVIQTLGFEISQRIARRFQVVGQLLRKSLIEGGMFHVDDDTLDVFVRDQLGEAV